MSSSKLPQTGMAAAGSFVIGAQLVGVILIALCTALCIYQFLGRKIDD